MDAELKAKWVVALRSGGHKQAMGKLHDCGAFCCIGIFEHVVCQKSITALELQNGRLCLDDDDGKLDERGLSLTARGELADMNDKGKTFAEIADYIEAKL
jgi:hypothetical protein